MGKVKRKAHPFYGIMKQIITDLKRSIENAERRKEGYMMFFCSTESAKKILQALHIAEMWEDLKKMNWRDPEDE